MTSATIDLPTRYRSTRGGASNVSFGTAVISGLASDGGLFVPHTIPHLPPDWFTKWRSLPFHQLATEIFKLYVDPAEIPPADLAKLAERSYSTFTHPDVTPVVNLKSASTSGADVRVLELFHGPTLAFKDVALQFVGNLFEYLLEKEAREGSVPQKLTVVGATSGDTGSAAIYGLRGKKNIDVYILFPNGRVSPVQEAQMTAVPDHNVHCLAVDNASFDDCQAVLKNLFADKEWSKAHRLAAVNSINWARILAQITYYFAAYFQTVGDAATEAVNNGQDLPKVAFSVPTGNFGDVLAGFYAAQMGLPVARLLIATNANDILHRFLRPDSGRYVRLTADASQGGGCVPTYSPAMDILVSSNFERLVWFLASTVPGGNAAAASAQVAGWMRDLSSSGAFAVGSEVLNSARRLFESQRVDDAETLATIRRHYDASGYVLDPHTAVGVCAVEKELAITPELAKVPIVCLATAHPAKFSEAVSEALQGTSFNFDTILPESVKALENMPKRRIDVSGATIDNVKKVVASTQAF
ncbi:tryptophan synthase beta subunit-like PLP-dependent enzyme [Ramicandelaber brevisporus]|nr:tryptophan synthase beta subunit-like PLP-dependent enzyme [Ramicandelaber brevisporus]